MSGRRPVVRPLEPTWVEHQGEQVLVLRDRTGVFDQPRAIPAPLGAILALCDGQRDEDELRASIEKQTGEPFPAEVLGKLLDDLERALILDGPAVERAAAEALAAYRAAPARPAALAGAIYPVETGELRRHLAAFGAGDRELPSAADTAIRGVVSPHIDYQRGGRIYHRVWTRAAPAIRNADTLVIFGTDHAGGPGSVTLTRQSFDTPLGILETDREVVDAVVAAIGERDAFAEELHHRGEHSIELAAVWAASVCGERRPTIVPVLCGSFHEFTHRDADPAANARFSAALDALQRATAGRRVIAVSAADLAHVGPAFGDSAALTDERKSDLRLRDERLTHAIASGRADELVGQLRLERDARRICGLPPTYLMLRYLGDCRGEVVGYEQCSADEKAGSVVTVAGILLW